MLGIRIRREQAEEARRRLTSAGLIDRSREIADDGMYAVMPLTATPRDTLLTGIDHEFVDIPFRPRRAREDPIDEIRRTAEVPDALREALPSKWELVGDVVVIRLPSELEEFRHEVASTYARVLDAKTVLRDTGGITGELRTPRVEKLVGDDTVTVHKENGVLFKLDLERVMFSSGNVDERVRVSKLDCDGEVIVDMFAGIGYFSLPIAVHRRPERIVSCELNPVAFEYLVENVRLNGVEDTVEPVLGDNRDLPGDSFADRVLMGYVKTTHEYLATAFKLVRNGGMVHYHETCPCELLPDRPVQRLQDALPNGDIEIIGTREVKSYSPGISHVVVDARVIKND